MTSTPVFVAALLALAALGVPVAFGVVPPGALAAAAIVLAVVAAFDAWRLRRLPTPTVERELPSIVPVGVEREVALRLRHDGAETLRADVHDLHPGTWPVLDLPQRVDVPPQRELRLVYRLTPTTRGRFDFEGCALRLLSPLRLWREQRVAPVRQSVRVYPNFAPLARLALVGAEQASRVVGAHLKRRRGEGTEFQQLREYRLGDSLRQIDWKASQRVRKLISREYQDEKHQQVLLVVDTGRRMLARDGATSHFDHALDAALVVGYLALRQGDAVGLFASGGEQRWMPPQRGMAALDTLLRAAYDLQPAAVATDYLAAAQQLSLRQRRRSLLLWVTNLRDEDIEDVLAAVRMLQRRHLVVIASLRERALDDALDTEVTELDQALRVGATARYMAERAAAHDLLRSHRVSVLDVTSEQLPGAVVQEYLSIKRKGLL